MFLVNGAIFGFASGGVDTVARGFLHNVICLHIAISVHFTLSGEVDHDDRFRGIRIIFSGSQQVC